MLCLNETTKSSVAYSAIGMGWIACLIVLIHLTACPASAFEEKKIVVAADPWCPYNCKPESDSPGYLIELTQSVFQFHGITIQYINLPWARALKYAKEGTIHAAIGAVRGNIAGHHINDEPLGKDETILVVRKGGGFEYTGTSVLDAKRLGIITNYTYDNHGEIDQYLNKRKGHRSDGLLILYQEDALDSLFNMLLLDRIDVVFENRYVAAYKAKELKVADQIEIIPTGKSVDIFFAFTPNSEGVTLSNMLDQGVRQLRKSGKLNEILKKYGIADWK